MSDSGQPCILSARYRCPSDLLSPDNCETCQTKSEIEKHNEIIEVSAKYFRQIIFDVLTEIQLRTGPFKPEQRFHGLEQTVDVFLRLFEYNDQKLFDSIRTVAERYEIQKEERAAYLQDS